LLSHVEAADPQAEAQLLVGLHPLEQRLWRWTAQRFAVSLAAPRPVPDLPVELMLVFTLPDVIVETLGPITITAHIDGVEVGSQRYEQPGVDLTFSAEVPADLLWRETTAVEFELDKAMIAKEEPKRELGIVFLSAALQ
jgi:hypothetical protein